MPNSTQSGTDERASGADTLTQKRDAFIASMSRLQFAADSAHQASFSYFDSVTNAHSNNGGPPVHLPPPVKKKGRPNTRIPQGPPDPNMPKKPMNSYNLFCAATRPAIMNDLGVKCPPKNVVAELVKRWNRISAQEKRKFMDQAIQLKSQYDEEMVRYNLRVQNENNIKAGQALLLFNQAAADAKTISKNNVYDPFFDDHIQRSSTPVYNSDDTESAGEEDTSISTSIEGEISGPDTMRAAPSPEKAPVKASKRKSGSRVSSGDRVNTSSRVTSGSYVASGSRVTSENRVTSGGTAEKKPTARKKLPPMANWEDAAAVPISCTPVLPYSRSDRPQALTKEDLNRVSQSLAHFENE